MAIVYKVSSGQHAVKHAAVTFLSAAATLVCMVSFRLSDPSRLYTAPVR